MLRSFPSSCFEILCSNLLLYQVKSNSYISWSAQWSAMICMINWWTLPWNVFYGDVLLQQDNNFNLIDISVSAYLTKGKRKYMGSISVPPPYNPPPPTPGASVQLHHLHHLYSHPSTNSNCFTTLDTFTNLHIHSYSGGRDYNLTCHLTSKVVTICTCTGTSIATPPGVV